MSSPLALSSNTQVQRVINATAAGTTAITGTAIDMQGFDRLSIIALFGTLTATAVTGIKLQQSDDDGSTDTYDDLAGSALSIPDTDSNKVLHADLIRPTKRYVKVVVTRGTANAVIDGVVVIKHGAMKAPVAKHSTVSGTEINNAPAEGTA